MAFDDLPSARSGKGRHSCDVCNKNGVFLKAAKVFCTFCTLMYCAEHEKVREFYLSKTSIRTCFWSLNLYLELKLLALTWPCN